MLQSFCAYNLVILCSWLQFNYFCRWIFGPNLIAQLQTNQMHMIIVPKSIHHRSYTELKYTHTPQTIATAE